MIIDAAAPRMVVVSDLHLGCPASRAHHNLEEFLDEVTVGGWALCINGDGFDLLQSSSIELATSAFPILAKLHLLVTEGLRVHYVLGNHDVMLEHILLDLPFAVSPFLNLSSGDRLIRVEHGHVYDPFFARAPGVYEFGGRLARLALSTRADSYELWARVQRFIDDRRRRDGRTRPYPHHAAATDLFRRGFDAVVFGHTHLPEKTELDGGLFVNGGDWLHHRTCVMIEQGRIEVLEWEPGLLA